MSDLISRQQAIEIVERYNKSHMVLKQQPMYCKMCGAKMDGESKE